MWSRFRSWLKGAFRRTAVERDLTDEMDFHLRTRTDHWVRQGLSPAEAARRARIEFGGIESHKENCRQARGLRWLDELRTDLRYGWRSLRARPTFSAVAVATLALGIGANTAVFSVCDALLFKHLPVPHAADLVGFEWLRTSDSMVAGYSGYGRALSRGVGIRTSFSELTFERFRNTSRAVTDVFAFTPTGPLTLVADGQTGAATGQLVTGNYYRALGVEARLGRVLTPLDDAPGAPPAAVITHRYWVRRFNADPAAIGKVVYIDRQPFTIVGVTPEHFEGIYAGESTDVTLALTTGSRLLPGGRKPPATWWLQIMGRLEPGVTYEQALADLGPGYRESVLESWAQRPTDTRDLSRTSVPLLRVVPGSQGPEQPRRDSAQVLLVLFAIVGAVLFMGCVNLASFLLARSSVRRQEVSLRLILGASRGRVVRQLLTESVLLSAFGGCAGIVFASWAKDSMAYLFSKHALIVDAAIDFRVLGFTAGLSVLTAIGFGLGPAWRTTRRDPGPALRTSPHQRVAGRSAVRKGLLVAQVAICVVLLVSAGLFLRTLQNFARVDVGFDTRRLLVFQLDPPAGPNDVTAGQSVYEDVLTAIATVPGVESATLSAMPLLAKSEWTQGVLIDAGGEPDEAYVQSVRWNFFDTLGLPVRAGRALTAGDRIGRLPVAVVNEAMARQIFEDPNPTGRRFTFADGPVKNISIEVVGVVADAKYASLDQEAPPTVYLPYTQLPTGAMTCEIRTTGDPVSLIPAVRSAVQGVSVDLLPYDLTTQDDRIAQTLDSPRMLALVTAIFGGVALFLTCIGLAGTVAFDVSRRTAEIGLRLALGAQRADVLRLILRDTAWIVMTGLAAGTVLTQIATRAVSSEFFGVRSSDPLSMALAALLLGVVAIVAALVPARRALGVDPVQALRRE